MILAALRLIKSLSGYHYRTVFITVLLPAIIPAVVAYLAPDPAVLRVVFYVAAFFVWSVLAVLAVASMLNRDRSQAEQLVAHQIEGLSEQISNLRERQEDLGRDLRQQISDLEETVRTTLREKLEVVLPPRPISIRARFTAGSPTVSVNLSVVGGSKLARFRLWVRRTVRRMWEVVYGKLVEE